MIQILFPLTITLAVETVVYMILKWGDLKLFIVVSLLNLVLNPLMNILLGLTTDQTSYNILLISYEIGTTLVEAFVIIFACRFKPWKTILFAFLANGSSLLVGFVLQPVYQTRVTIIVLTIVFALIYLAIATLTMILYTKKRTN